jgi:Glycoside-hydrolase family GH114
MMIARKAGLALAWSAAALLPPAQAETAAPKPGASFSWLLSAQGDPPYADVIDLDLFDTSAADVAALKVKGAHLVCYINVGAFEDWRPDRNSFPADIIGKEYDGWAGERWLDIRQIAALGPVLKSRFKLCKDKGFDAVEPDNLDGFETRSGFPLTRADQIKFNRWIADEAHAIGLSIGLKNVPDQLPELAGSFDWALLEDCFDQGWCADYAPFRASGKAVFTVEYSDNHVDLDAFCAQMTTLGFSGLLKNRSLDKFEKRCPD